MLESFITLCCVFTILAYVTTRKLGLLDPVPRDPKARVAGYTSSILSLLKVQLIHSRLEQWEPGRIRFVKGTAAGTIWVEDGYVHCRNGASESTLPLGDMGSMTFELRGKELSITIVAAESTGVEHFAQISLPMAGVPRPS